MRHETPATTDVATDFLTAAEVAIRLRVSRSTVYNLIASGRLAAHCNGGGKVRPRGLRVPESAVAEYLASSRISTEAEAA
ncbi:helix-turn-helix domain-containing protein [Streptomyces sp. NPDC059016]|uniref:helix-turn-helix domain-containing protein n=1 Tax=Streptomyces sp. NPDC059016 TaxID=3346699 RepID=UPI00367EED9B